MYQFGEVMGLVYWQTLARIFVAMVHSDVVSFLFGVKN